MLPGLVKISAYGVDTSLLFILIHLVLQVIQDLRERLNFGSELEADDSTFSSSRYTTPQLSSELLNKQTNKQTNKININTLRSKERTTPRNKRGIKYLYKYI